MENEGIEDNISTNNLESYNLSQQPSDRYKRPQHVRFKCSTPIGGKKSHRREFEVHSDPAADGYENCDVRLTKVELVENPAANESRLEPNHGQDVFFYRMGLFNFHKLNFN